MSLLVTSCTMGKQPDRLLHKGPQYLRTRTNHGIFSTENRKSAVELLAASKAQFYSIKDRTILDRGQDLAVTTGQHHRYSNQKEIKNEPPPARSKSEYNLSQLQLSNQADNDDNDDGDVNNNNSSFCSSNNDNVDPASTETDAVVEGTRRLSLETPRSRDKLCKQTTCSKTHLSINANRISQALHSIESFEDSPGLVNRNVGYSHPNLNETTTHKEGSLGAHVERTKPSPSPRTSREKPIPPPRRRSPRVAPGKTEEHQSHSRPSPVSNVTSDVSSATQNSCVKLSRNADSSVLRCEALATRHTDSDGQTKSSNVLKPTKNTLAKPKIPPRPVKLDVTAVRPNPPRQKSATPGHGDKAVGSPTDGRRKSSLVETLTKRFTSLSASTPPKESNCVSSDTCSATPTSEKPQVLYKATPVFINTSENLASLSVCETKPLVGISSAKPNILSPVSSTLRESNGKCIAVENVSRAGRKRCPDVEHYPESLSKREKRSADVSKICKAKDQSGRKISGEFLVKNKSAAGVFAVHHTSKSEMSIESAEQAVSESEISAIPLADMESDTLQCSAGDEPVEGQEIIRRNSSRSGRLDQGDASQSSGGSGQRHSSGGCSSSVPRSHSDISFRLGGGSGISGTAGELSGQHSRDSSIVSSHSRLSRTSVGADLENFFNQMGLEMGVLEPIARLRELHTSSSGGRDLAPSGEASTFGSMSSLDSQDAASICSTYSRSEHDCVATAGLSLGASGGAEGPTLQKGHQHQQTSIVERNARIIKWLCNVKKAIKGGHNKAEAENTTSPGKA